MFNPFEPGYFENPYQQYAALRESDPVHESPLGVWVLFRYDDVLPLLRNPNLSVEDQNAAPTARMTQMIETLGDDREQRGSRSLLSLDPPDHTRLRRLVTRAFTPKVLEGLRPRIQGLVDDALDKLAGEGEGDLIRQLAFPLPFAVISDMLGMPESDSDRLRGWSHTMVKTLDPIISPEDAKAAMEASDQMNDYVTDVLAWKRKNPADDLLSALISAEDDGDMLTEQELMDQVVLLY
ncbi:MAG: hypothetical protein QOG64_1263, partial [Acidimicrobiaceae bacterium]|nr:hypothetical protein [Acidimicrobiaceae bacterium]